MKVCSKCKISKNNTEYYKDSRSKDKLQSVCKSCKVISVKNSPSYLDPHKRKAQEGTDKRRAYKREYHHKHKVARNISRRMRQSLNGERKSQSWLGLVDFSLDDLKLHLEFLFHDGMSWDNYGEWHIDHILPIASFDITSDSCTEFKKCWSLDNLQPLWKEDNFKKSNSIMFP